MSTIYEIAKKAGVSPTTVSKVINNYPDVSEKTRERIKKILKEENFYPNFQAQSLITKKSWTIGVLYFEELEVGLAHPFFSKVIEGVKKEADKKGYSLLFGSKNARLKNDTFFEYFRYKAVDGIVIICYDPDDAEVIEIVNSDTPSVLIDMKNEKTSTVTSDNEEGTRIVIDYFKSLGHKKIAHIYGTDNELNLPSTIRCESFIKYMRLNELEIKDEYIISSVDFDFDGGYKAMERLLKLEDRPTAVYASGDKIALGAIEAIKNNKLRVPEDISVIGFDDIEISKYVTPKLTTVRQQTDKMGKEAVDILIDQIDNNKKTIEKRVVPVELVIRESCDRINK